MLYTYNKILKTNKNRALLIMMATLFGLLVAFGSLTGVQAKNDKKLGDPNGYVQADFTYDQREDNTGHIPWETVQLIASGDNENGGDLRWNNPDNDNQWAEATVSCLRVAIGSGDVEYANIAGQITSFGDEVPTEADLQDRWFVLQLGYDPNDAGLNEPGNGPEYMHSGGIYDLLDNARTEEGVNSICEGSAPDGEDIETWSRQSIVIPETDDGYIDVTAPTRIIERTYQLPAELTQLPDRGQLDMECGDGGRMYTQIAGEFTTAMTTSYSPSQKNFEKEKKNASKTVSVDVSHGEVWANGQRGEAFPDSPVLYFNQIRPLQNTVEFFTNDLVSFSLNWAGELIDPLTGEFVDDFDIDINVLFNQFTDEMIEFTGSQTGSCFNDDGGGGEEDNPGSIHANFVTTNLFGTSETDGNFQLFKLHNVTPELDNPEVMMAFDYQSGMFFEEEGEPDEGGQDLQAISYIELSCVNIAEDGGSAFISGYAKDYSDAFAGEWLVIQLVDGDTDGIYWSIPTWNEPGTADAVTQTCIDGVVDPVAEGWNYSEAYAWDDATEAVVEGADAIDIQPASIE